MTYVIDPGTPRGKLKFLVLTTVRLCFGQVKDFGPRNFSSHYLILDLIVVILDLSKGARLEFCRAGTGSRERAQINIECLQVKEEVVKCPWKYFRFLEKYFSFPDDRYLSSSSPTRGFVGRGGGPGSNRGGMGGGGGRVPRHYRDEFCSCVPVSTKVSLIFNIDFMFVIGPEL